MVAILTRSLKSIFTKFSKILGSHINTACAVKQLLFEFGRVTFTMSPSLRPLTIIDGVEGSPVLASSTYSWKKFY